MATITIFDFQNYTRLLPNRMGESMVASGIVSCLATVIRTGNFYFACSAGAFSVIAAAVDGLMRPFIEHTLGHKLDDAFFDVESFYLRAVTIYTLSCLVGPTFGVSITLIGAVALASISPCANRFLGLTSMFSRILHSNGYIIIG